MGLYWRLLKSEFIFLFGLIWAAVGTPFLGVSAWNARSFIEMEKRGVAAEATLVEKTRSSDKDNSSNYTLKYLFHDASGREHVQKTQVDWETWRSFADGDRLQVLYLPERPSASRIAGGAGKKKSLIFIAAFGFAGLLFGGVGWFLLIKAVRRAGKSISLIRNGMPVEGRVDKIEEASNIRINGRCPIYLRFSFTGPDGRRRQGESRYLPFTLENRWQQGGRVAVLYDPLDLERFEADVLGLRLPGGA